MSEVQTKEQRLQSLMDEYGDSVLRMCYVYLKDYQLAEDVTQETFIRVYQYLDEFKGQSSIKTWIIQIAINLSKNQMRTNWWKNRVDEELPDIPTNEYSDSFVDRQLIMNEVSKLPSKYREVILLYYYQELSIAEVAMVLHINESTVKSRLSRAKKKLKPELKEVLCYE